MPKPQERVIASFKEYVEIIEQRQSKAKNSLWYRGCGKSTHALVPTLFRHKTAKTKEALEQLERQLMVRFRQRSIPLHNRSLADEWDTLFFMQHYGVPTRLLDWTENPFIGFYFAVTSGPFSVSKGTRNKPPKISFSSDAAIWIFNPVEWNNHATSQQGKGLGILTPGDDALLRYKPVRRFDEIPVHPVALYGAHNSPRIVAQRGVFTMYGNDTSPMEDAYEKFHFPAECLIKVILKREKLPNLRTAILQHGITESVVFPDLEGLAREMKREFQFEF
jgi:FRG domain